MHYTLLKIFTLLLFLGLVYGEEEIVNYWGVSLVTLSQNGTIPVSVLPGLPADISGVKTGDALTQIDGKDFTTVREAVDIILNMPARKFNIVIIRGMDKITLETYCLRVTKASLNIHSQLMFKSKNNENLP
jgi:C-terminal processing protease CtpA/Prc